MLRMAAAALPEDLDRAFTTTVAFITTRSSKGDNVMAAEWTYQVSYTPFLVAVVVDPRHATHAAIVESKEFGVSLASDDQNALSSFTGGFSQREAEKLTSGEVPTRPGEVIGARLVEGSLAQLECKLVATHALGDHTQFVGEVVAARVAQGKGPLILHGGYHRLGEKIPRGTRLFLTLTREGDAHVRVDGFLYADRREGARVALTVEDGEGHALESSVAVSDRGGFFEWHPAAQGAARAWGEVEGVRSQASLPPG